MNILQELHDKLNESVIGNISSIANETPHDTNKALAQLNALFLGILTHEPISKQQISKIQTVLDEGGHTGDLLDNLSFLLGDKQRASMLVSIGTNIFNHFYTGDFETLTEKISIILGVKKSSIQTLLGLTPPLVLASLGKIIRRERMESTDIKNLLSEQQDIIKEWLSPYLIPQLSQSDFKESQIFPIENEPVSPKAATTYEKQPIFEEKADDGMRKKVAKKPSLFQTFLPWGLLFVSVVGSFIYLKNLTSPVQKVVELGDTDSLSLLDDNSNLSFLENSKTDTETKQQPAEEVSQKENTTEKPAAVSAEKPVKTTDQSSSKENKTEKVSAEGSFTHSGMFKNTFTDNSAEIKNDQVVVNFFKKWQLNPSQIIEIQYAGGNKRLFEDQSYALRESLYKMGVPLKQIQLSENNNLGNEKIKVIVQ